MSDTPQGSAARIGDNIEAFDLTLALDPDVLRQRLEATPAYEAKLARVAELKASFARFSELTKDGIADRDTAAKATTLAKMLDVEIDSIDALRVAAKRPVDGAAAVIQVFFARGMVDPLYSARRAVVDKLDAYADKVEAEEKARLQQQAAAAAKIAEEAAARAEVAPTAQNIGQAIVAEEQAETAATPAVIAQGAREASKVVTDQGHGFSRALGPWQVDVVDLTKVPAEYWLLNEALALAKVKTDKRLAKLELLTDAQQPIAGLRFYRGKSGRVR